MSAGLGSQPTSSEGAPPAGQDRPEAQLPLEWRTSPDGPLDGDQAPQTPPSAARRAWSLVSEWLVVGVCALGLALLLKTFLVEVFVIPSGSMEPTLMVDNRVVVYKLGYRLHDVNRGDVIVFRHPGQTADADDLIKRVVALGGETFEIRGTQVHIDGARLEEPYLQQAGSTHPTVPIPGCVNDPEPDLCVVPEGEVLVLGDNRPDSRDGRYFGPIDVDTVVGRAFLKLWPPNDLGGV
ncbi:MAG: signal peptidase I [Acidimicrobiaceae bacterium]|nr:signal peptidase I [Acidimicrobiaceae bacterium]